MALRVCCMADLHGRLPRIPECDLLLLAGDFWEHVPGADEDFHEEQRVFLDRQVRPWLDNAPVQMVIATPGNHDFLFQVHPERVPILPWSLLKQHTLTAYAVFPHFTFTVWGTAWTPWFGGWAFNAPKQDIQEVVLREAYASCPEGLDILLSHGPAHSHLDQTSDGRFAGSNALTDTIERCHPRLVVCGHIHEGRGTKWVGETLVVNAALCDSHYLIKHNPVMLTWDTESRRFEVESL